MFLRRGVSDLPSRQINDFSQKGYRKNELVARPGVHEMLSAGAPEEIGHVPRGWGPQFPIAKLAHVVEGVRPDRIEKLDQGPAIKHFRSLTKFYSAWFLESRVIVKSCN